MSIDVWHQVFVIGGVILAILTASAGVGGYLTQRVIDERQETRIRALQPRVVSASQKSALATALIGRHGRVGVISRLMDGESADFADEIASAFRAVGWDIAPAIRTSLNDLPGIVTVAVTGDGLNPTAEAICRALDAAGLPCRATPIPANSIGGQLEPDTIYVLVGRKR